MKVIIALVVLIALAAAAPAPADSDASASIVRYDNDNIGVDGYNYAYETSNGISAQQEGHLEGQGEDEAIAVKGQYTFTDPSGKTIVVTYVADANGYRPSVQS